MNLTTILDRAQDKSYRPSTVHGIRVETSEQNGTQNRTTSELWEAGKTKGRIEIRSIDGDLGDIESDGTMPADQLSNPGDVFLVNDGTIWVYYSADNSYTTITYPDPSAIAGSLTRGTLIDDHLEAAEFDVTSDGTTTVAGRDGYVLSFTPNDTAGPLHRNIFESRFVLDCECYFPLETEFHYADQEGLISTLNPFASDTPDTEGDTIVETRTFDSIEFNTDLDDDVFVFTPPEDAVQRDDVHVE